MAIASMSTMARELLPLESMFDARSAVQRMHRAAEAFDTLDADVVRLVADGERAAAVTRISELGEVVARVGLTRTVFGRFADAPAAAGAASIDYGPAVPDPARTIAHIRALHSGVAPLHRSMTSRLVELHGLTQAAAGHAGLHAPTLVG